MTRLIETLDQIADDYDVLYCDLWGCVHDGLRALPEAVLALNAFRAAGKTVVLVTNSPRPRASVATQLDSFGVPTSAWDAIASSGDAARVALFEGAVGRDVWFIGAEHDRAFLDPLALVASPIEPRLVAPEAAEGIVCCGFPTPGEEPEAYRPTLEAAVGRGLKLLCANPDIVVDRGETREWCAGALARLYTDLGGESLYFGKPHGAIYDLARRRLDETGRAPDSPRILAVGDGIHTDIRGARDAGIDSLFVTGGLAARETRTDSQPEPQALAAYVEAEGVAPDFAIGFLR
ncbi:TIGR01459 family HAD-type hydrolase [Mesobaculum littorinae]|uniref:TIGR01459 family HAD-type hydrolase n=1 Tax=Mesobaculum littorinae TaxID=2486419 RepID=A0A438AKJ3_9RHOB|nr:TIGR01459 family HAD-type hydrolase [Mesobaculum littorinae]RVV99126.1 TIGR01459 family HAD-type hydrolase [Mesobaculum littorinae]